MSNQSQSSDIETQTPVDNQISDHSNHKRRALALQALMLLLVFVGGLGSGYLMGQQSGHDIAASSTTEKQENGMTLMEQINPPAGYKIPAVFGDIGPQLVAAGAIDLVKFTDIYRQQTKPLTDDQMSILTKETAANVVINPENAYFLLNFFWALGLTNQNVILTEGPMMSKGKEQVGGYASTGGWTIGAKKPTELFASSKIVTLTDEQQARLLEVASGVYRPCCNNPTHFPDCNHGMAMLGLLELMASQNASSEEMFETAKYVNAFWYPQQMLEVATAFKASKNVDFAEADAKTVVSDQYSSGSGFQAVHQYLSQNGLLEQAPSSGGSCGVQ
ncbi:MAG: hypothetical protein A2032_05065 [Chloroflexi bacterium RBG_19FT_COMBO_49_13]|nr:MAG: hypothetical protein A2Y53_04040 [Chloroflexi bacterium RBG_16_47_49]OGO62175.1 MAG: hypothetical protein A2032_05065 [Chloroflexi bacterium RBG_19FT_COMBO_49_13]